MGYQSRMARRKRLKNRRSRLNPVVSMAQRSLNGGGEVVLLRSAGRSNHLDVRLEQDTVWLTQAQMAELFGKNVRTISEHIRNVFKEKELDDTSVIRNFRITG